MYCVYLTIYRGNRLPPFYIGSSSIDKVKSGYNGSVTSKAYGRIWRSERENNKHLFKTVILKTFESRKDATRAEARLQEARKVVTSPLYVNLALAKPNGFFGNGSRGEAHPTHRKNYKPSEETRKRLSLATSGSNNGMFGRKHSVQSKLQMSITKNTRPLTEEMHLNYSRAKSGENHPNWGKQQKRHVIEAMRAAVKGKPKSASTKAKLSKAREGKVWWTDGVSSKMAKDCPGDGWRRGMTKSH